MTGLFHNFIFEPLYNGLIFLLSVTPLHDLGIAVIVFTCLVKLILFPLSKKSVQTQMMMKKIEPELKKIKEKYPNKEEQARKTLEMYKQYEINPFSGFFLILIQIPIIFGLYYVFLKGGLPVPNPDLLYSFTPVIPADSVNMHFLGLIDISGKSFVLALIAGVSQYFQAHLSLPPVKKSNGEKRSFQEDLAHGMGMQMRYVLPVVVFFVAYSISGAIALYWATSNIFAIGQELFMRKRLIKNDPTLPQNQTIKVVSKN